MASDTKEILNMKDIVKTYIMGEEEQVVLDGVNFTVNEGSFISVLGPSGSGKSTLMNIIGCLDVPTKGKYILNGNEVEGLSEAELAQVRNKEIGFVFQQFQLLPRLSALQNVELPLIYSGIPDKKRKEMAKEMLIKVGLADKLKNRPNQLSGGQQQRVAIARALVTQPTILLADEPTGALDQKTGKQIMELFKELNDEGKTIVMITHDKKIARYAKRVVKILDGKISEDDIDDEDEVTTLSSESKSSEFIKSISKRDIKDNLNPQTGEILGQLFNAFVTVAQDEKIVESASNFAKMLGEKFNTSKSDSNNTSEKAIPLPDVQSGEDKRVNSNTSDTE